jgi:hypothetical protein
VRSELSHALRTERERPDEVLEGGVDVSGERLEAGSVVGGLPGVGVAGELLGEERPRLLVAPRVCLRERDLEVLPRLRLERFPWLSAPTGAVQQLMPKARTSSRCRSGISTGAPVIAGNVSSSSRETTAYLRSVTARDSPANPTVAWATVRECHPSAGHDVFA